MLNVWIKPPRKLLFNEKETDGLAFILAQGFSSLDNFPKL